MTHGAGSRISAKSPQTVIGIDVGGRRKGFHAVALTDGQYAGCHATTNVDQLVAWCRETNAQTIAIDAPCAWSKDGRARPAERQLMAQGIWCFSTTTRERAIAHPKDYYGWMLRGEALFQALKHTHPLGLPSPGRKCCFETFPHAIAWHLMGGQAVASQKRAQRRALLEEAGVDLTELTNIDLVDAALCALAAHYAAIGEACRAYGEPETGFIVVPDPGPDMSTPSTYPQNMSLKLKNSDIY